MGIAYRAERTLPRDQVVHLYRANRWSSGDKPDELLRALSNSDAVVSAWDGDILIGLGNSITDGALVAYYPHLLVLPEYQRQGIGREIMRRMAERYGHLHQQILVAETPAAAAFYERIGFSRIRGAAALEIYRGTDH